MQQHSNIPRKPMDYLWYVAKMYPGWMIGAFIFVTLATAVGIASTYMTKVIVDHIEAGVDQSAELWKSIIILGVLYMLINPLWRLSGIFGSLWSEGGWKKSYDILFAHLIRHSDRYFQDRFAGSVTNKINHVAQGLFDIYTMTLWGLYSGIMSMIMSMVLVTMQSRLIGVLFAVWIVLFYILARFLLPKKSKLSYITSKRYSKLKGIAVDIVTNASSVRNFSRHSQEVALVEEASEKSRVADLKSWWYGEFLRFVFMLMNHGITIGVLVLGVMLWLDGQVTAGDMLLFYWLAEKLSETLRELGNNFDSFMKHYGQIDEGLEEIIIDYDLIDVPSAEALTISKGAISIKDVTFSYGGLNVFDRLNIDIPAGQKVGLVGSSGAGKSTLVQLLLRQYDIRGGSISFDDQDISQVTQDSVRESVAFIPQDPNLFHRSIRDNIAYGNPSATDEQIFEAARLAQADEFIVLLEKGYSTLVGERGVKLSGGQRQRIIIARAILKNAPILILDEATSALDSESEKKIQKALTQLMKGKTVIAIAHRLSTIKHLDRILVLENGKIVEDGTHAQLQSNGGRYADLWSHQVDGFIGE